MYLDMTANRLTFFSMSYQRQSFDFSRRPADRNFRALSCESQAAIISRFTLCLLRDRVCIWMRSQWTHPSRRDEGAGFEASQWLRTYGESWPRILRRRESWESNECYKVARRRTAIAVKLYGMTSETTRCCRIVGVNTTGLRNSHFQF